LSVRSHPPKFVNILEEYAEERVDFTICSKRRERSTSAKSRRKVLSRSPKAQLFKMPNRDIVVPMPIEIVSVDREDILPQSIPPLSTSAPTEFTTRAAFERKQNKGKMKTGNE